MYKNPDGISITIPCDEVICATGQRPLNPNWIGEIRGKEIYAYTIGDATTTGDMRRATRSAFDVIMPL